MLTVPELGVLHFHFRKFGFHGTRHCNSFLHGSSFCDEHSVGGIDFHTDRRFLFLATVGKLRLDIYKTVIARGDIQRMALKIECLVRSDELHAAEESTACVPA